VALQAPDGFRAKSCAVAFIERLRHAALRDRQEAFLVNAMMPPLAAT